MQKDGIKDRKYQGVLYPDSESYCCDDVLNILKSTFPEFAYILHDKDVDENGELKKPHTLNPIKPIIFPLSSSLR